MSLTDYFMKQTEQDHQCTSTRAGSPLSLKPKKSEEMLKLLKIRSNKIEENQQLMEKKFSAYAKHLEMQLQNKVKQNQLLKQQINKETVQLIQVAKDIKIIDEFFLKQFKNKLSSMNMGKVKRAGEKISKKSTRINNLKLLHNQRKV